MHYQRELKCVRCDAQNTIRKVKLHGLFTPQDEHVYFMCTACKSYGSMYESLTSNADDFPLMLEEEWEWADEKLLEEPTEEITLEEFMEKADEQNEKGRTNE